MTRLTGFLIDPVRQTLKRVSVREKTFLPEVYGLLECSTIERVSCRDYDLWIDEEGQLQHIQDQVWLAGLNQLLAGRVVILGGNDEDGSSQSTKFPIKDTLSAARAIMPVMEPVFVPAVAP